MTNIKPDNSELIIRYSQVKKLITCLTLELSNVWKNKGLLY
jgi:hypothetical protein